MAATRGSHKREQMMDRLRHEVESHIGIYPEITSYLEIAGNALREAGEVLRQLRASRKAQEELF